MDEIAERAGTGSCMEISKRLSDRLVGEAQRGCRCHQCCQARGRKARRYQGWAERAKLRKPAKTRRGIHGRRY